MNFFLMLFLLYLTETKVWAAVTYVYIVIKGAVMTQTPKQVNTMQYVL